MLELRNIFKGSGGTSVSVADMDFLQNSKKIIRTTGISKVNILTRDELLGSFIELLVNHAELIESCSLLIVVNQTKPFELPQVSNFILEHIGCKHNIECIDVNLGCTGFVYATTLADRLLHNNAECLILTGDAISSELEIDDFVNRPLFGDAAFLTHFIKINDNVNHLNLNVFNGSKSLYFNKHNSHFLNSAGFHMNGIEVFNFGIHKVSRVIKDFN
jgi:3-oxoacyl-[acyl-carrier-protein] synthase III